MKNLVYISLVLLIASCQNKKCELDAVNKQSFISQEVLDSINCPKCVLIIPGEKTVAFHWNLNCRYIVSSKQIPNLISSDSIPDSLHPCSYCLKLSNPKDSVADKNNDNSKRKATKNKNKYRGRNPFDEIVD